MAASVSLNHPGSYNGGGIHNSGIQSGIAFEIEISECVAASSPIPKRVRQRLEESSTESKFKSPASLEEIEFKLKEADSRRQQFHEWLANKARSKPRSSPSHSEQAENLAQRLEAKLSAAEQKRAEILAQEQTRLAKLHEVRVAAKTEAQLRAEREREELGSKVEFRVQQAEINRLGLVEAEKQRIAAVHERIAQSILQRTTQEGRDRARIEALRATICQKIAAAEEKRAGLLEAEKNRAQACVLQARRVAKAVVRERELEMWKKKEKLEARLQRAKRQRAEYLMKRGGCRGSCHNHGHKLHKHGDRLCRKLTRCWRQFRGSRSTTYALAQEYAACAINQELVMSLPFEQLASRITSPATLRGVKPLLARIESRLMLSSAGKSNIGQVEHLLKRLSPPRRKTGGPSIVGKQTSMGGASKGSGKDNTGRSQIAAAVSKASSKETTPKVVVDDRELERYPARVFLCAYMILGQPDAVFSGRGGRENALAEAAAKLLPEFEALLSIILDGPPSTVLPPSPTVDGSTEKSGFDPSAAGEPQLQQKDQSNFRLPSPQRPFSAQLASFDAAWCSYLYHFVAWKVKDAQLLEEDLTRMACQLELSMLQKCKGGNDLSHDSQAIRTQVQEDQKLLHDRILRLTGAAGASRMEEALCEVRSKFNEAVENGSPLPSPFASPAVPSRTPIASPSSPSPFIAPSERIVGPKSSSTGNRPSAIRSLFNSPDKSDSLTAAERTSPKQVGLASHPVVTTLLPSEWTRSSSSNEKIVSDMLHDQSWQSNDNAQHLATGLGSSPSTQMTNLQAQIRSTMEAAFWDGIVEGLVQSPPKYQRVVTLVGEIKEELQTIVPDKWKQDLQERMDLDILAQVLESGNNDFEYLRQLLDYASSLILKLGAPVRDSGTKAAHQSLLSDLAVAAGSNGEAQSTFANALVKGLRFIFDQLQILKQDIISARLRSLAPLINGSAGVVYVRKAFAARFNLTLGVSTPVEELSSKLPRTSAWIGEVISRLEHEKAELETSIGAFRGSCSDLVVDGPAVGLPPIPSMRTGGRVVVGGSATNSLPAVSSGGEVRSRALVWKSNDTILRMGVLQIIQRVEPSTEANVPETLGLNVEWLRGCQNEFQRMIVMATGLLVARQGLTGKGIPATQLDTVMQEGCAQLDALLNEPTASISQIGALLAQISSKAGAKDAIQDIAAYGELMTRVLTKSLSADDAVFARVSAAVVSSLRAVLLLGKGAEGLGVAKLALKRIGGGMLIEKVINICDMLDKLSSISCSVHEPWYSCMVTNMS
ncbi:unnamed protein product [Calypogeia fissa]